jgi:hypothetical protein
MIKSNWITFAGLIARMEEGEEEKNTWRILV